MNAAAIPEKLEVMFAGSTAAASLSTAAIAVPSDTPLARLNEMFSAGICPEWFTVTGPIVRLNVATELSGTTGPSVDRTYSVPSAETSA